MHELSIASGILDIVRHYVPERDGARLRSVRVRIGDVAGVLPDSLDFCFDAVVAGTPYASAHLEIESVVGDDLRVVEVEVADEVMPWPS